MKPAITVINLWQFWSTCQRCACLTKDKKGWPYYETFIFGIGEPWQVLGGYVPVCEPCYLELLNEEANTPCR